MLLRQRFLGAIYCIQAQALAKERKRLQRTRLLQALGRWRIIYFDPMAHEVFISYAVTDKTVADAVCAQLEGVHHVQCWIAPRDATPGGSSSESTDALDRSKIMVLIFRAPEGTSLNADGSTPVKRVVEHAVRKGINVIPLRFENDMPDGALKRQIESLGESIKALLEQGRARSSGLASAAARAVPGVAPAPPVQRDAPAKPSWLVPEVVGGAMIVAVVVLAALLIRNRSIAPAGPEGETVRASASAGPAAAGTLGTASLPASTSAPARAPEPATTPSSDPSISLEGAAPTPSALAPRAGSQAAQEARPASAAGSTPAVFPPDRAPAPLEGSAADKTAESAGGSSSAAAAVKAVADKVTARAADSKAGSGEPAGTAAPSVQAAGTLFIDFLNTFPDGSVEVEIDGQKRWSERLRLSKPVGVWAMLKLQRVSEQLGSELKVPAGDHEITVTMLNAEGEVRDIGTTSLHVYASRSVTLRIRITRFRNRMLLESAAG